MRRRRIAALVSLLVICAVSACLSGLTYYPGIGDSGEGRTIWTDGPTPASFWHRDANQDVYTIGYAVAFNDTPVFIITTNVVTTAHGYDTGFWELDSNGDTSMRLLTGYAAHIDEKWSRKDAQWGMDSNGDIYPFK